jgi:hypothetical protein
MGTKVIEFEADEFAKLLTHYTDGLVPLDFRVLHVAVDSMLTRQIAFIGESAQWQDEPVKRELLEKTGAQGDTGGYAPLQLRYEGKRVMNYGQKGNDPFWQDAEAPKWKG